MKTKHELQLLFWWNKNNYVVHKKVKPEVEIKPEVNKIKPEAKYKVGDNE